MRFPFYAIQSFIHTFHQNYEGVNNHAQIQKGSIKLLDSKSMNK
jgi:hypothetical protein